MKQKAKLVYNTFSPMKGNYNFFYKPSFNNNIIIFCPQTYGEYLEKLYGEFPKRLNPIVLRVEIDNETIVTDLLLDRNNTVLMEEILNDGGDCFIEMKYVKNTIVPLIVNGHVVLHPMVKHQEPTSSMMTLEADI